MNSVMERMTAMEHRHSTDMEIMKQQLSVVATAAILPLISNLSAQILLWLLARQPRNLKEAKLFSHINREDASQIRSCTDDMGDWNVKDCKRDADNIIRSRNILTHATTIEELWSRMHANFCKGRVSPGKCHPKLRNLYLDYTVHQCP